MRHRGGVLDSTRVCCQLRSPPARRCRLLAAAAGSWRVQSASDDVQSLALSTGVSTLALRAANPGVDFERLYPGLILVVPRRVGGPQLRAADPDPDGGLQLLLAPSRRAWVPRLDAVQLPGSEPTSLTPSAAAAASAAAAEPVTHLLLVVASVQLAGLLLYAVAQSARAGLRRPPPPQPQQPPSPPPLPPPPPQPPQREDAALPSLPSHL